MAGETNLETLLKTMSPEISSEDYVFCSVKGNYGDYEELNPLASFCESEGLTLILRKEQAKEAGFDFESTFKAITLTVHSSLESVGLTAAVSSKLADKGISANIVAAYYHDHIFVQSSKAEAALEALNGLAHS